MPWKKKLSIIKAAYATSPVIRGMLVYLYAVPETRRNKADNAAFSKTANNSTNTAEIIITCDVMAMLCEAETVELRIRWI